MLTSVASLVLGILQNGTEGWEAAAPKAARTLTRLVLNKDYSNDYLYYGIPTPWLQIKLLRMLQFFPPPEEHALKMRVTEVLQRIVAGTDVTKNVNKNNSTHAVLFEAIQLVIHMGPTSEQLPQACNLLGRFISIREANIRYLGLETMARLSQQQPETMEQLKKHQSTILFSLKDPDISIRRRALDLVYSMCDTSTVKETVSELLTFLTNADVSIKEELVLKIAILAERFCVDHQATPPPRLDAMLPPLTPHPSSLRVATPNTPRTPPSTSPPPVGSGMSTSCCNSSSWREIRSPRRSGTA